MSPLWSVLTVSAVVLVLTGWLPDRVRAAPTIVAAVFVMASGGLALAVLGVTGPTLLVLLGAGIGLGFALGHRLPARAGVSLLDRSVRWTVALALTVASVGLVVAGGAGATAYPVFTPPAAELVPVTAVFRR